MYGSKAEEVNGEECSETGEWGMPRMYTGADRVMVGDTEMNRYKGKSWVCIVSVYNVDRKLQVRNEYGEQMDKRRVTNTLGWRRDDGTNGND